MMPNDNAYGSSNRGFTSQSDDELLDERTQRGVSQDQGDNIDQSQSDHGQNYGQFNSDISEDDLQDIDNMDNEGDLQPDEDVTVGKWIRSNNPVTNRGR
jgi:hypothetical protein